MELFKQYLNSWNYELNGAFYPNKENCLVFYVSKGKYRHYRIVVSYEGDLPKIVDIEGTKTFDKDCAIAIAKKMMEVQFDWLRFLHNLPDEEDDAEADDEWDDV